jgi:hypothetical protein
MLLSVDKLLFSVQLIITTDKLSDAPDCAFTQNSNHK